MEVICNGLKVLVNTVYDYGVSIALDSSNFVYTVGQFQGSVDLDPSANTYTALSNGGFDGFIQKLNSNGQFI